MFDNQEKLTARLIYDMGDGFEEKNTYEFEYTLAENNSIGEKIMLPEGTKRIRYVIVTGDCGCILCDGTVMSDRGALTPEPLNGAKTGASYIFAASNPAFEVSVDDIEWIRLDGKLFPFDDRHLFGLFAELEECSRLHAEYITQTVAIAELRRQLRHKNSEYVNANATVKRLSRQNAELALVNTSVLNSTCWKITAPLRLVRKPFIRLDSTERVYNPNASVFKRGLDSIRYEGLFGTVRKLVNRSADKRALGKMSMLSRLSPEERAAQINHKFSKEILFSILVPLYNTPVEFLEELIDYTRAQTYPRWELCLADGSDAEHAPAIAELCNRFAQTDPRVRYRKLENNLGISKNTNACAEMATGNFFCLLDHDDLLHQSALYKMMCRICDNDADFVYTDEAVFVGGISNIVTFHFKPDFAPDNLRANNYICHFTGFSRSLFEKVGGFRSEFDGSQDHDLILRLTAIAHKVAHVPEILYFWRSHPRSVAQDIGSKPYAILAGRHAAQASIEAAGMSAEVTSAAICPTIYRFAYKLTEKPRVSIIIANKSDFAAIDESISGILEGTTYADIEIIVVECDDSDDSASALYEKTDRRVHSVHHSGGYNAAALLNTGAAHASGKYLLFLESGSRIVNHDWIEQLLMYACRDDVGAVGGKIYFEDNTVRHAGCVLGMGKDGIVGRIFYRVPRESVGYMGRLHYSQDVSAVTAECMMIKHELFNSINGFDEAFFTDFHDIDLCLRLREKGLLNVFTPGAELYCGVSIEKPEPLQWASDKALFANRWRSDLLKADPYFSPNFDPKRYDCRVLMPGKNRRGTGL